MNSSFTLMQDEIKDRVKQIITLGNFLSTKEPFLLNSIFSEAFYQWEAQTHSFLINIFGEDSFQYKMFVKDAKTLDIEDTKKNKLNRGLGVLKAAQIEIEKGYFKKISAIISADIFTDFLDMASYLLFEGYKDAAAVMIGSVLEEHLRKLCDRNNIDLTYQNPKGELLPKKADTMNADLAKANIYNLLDQKNITAWLDLRNKAAHGKYSEYTKEQVDLMRQGITDFITRISL